MGIFKGEHRGFSARCAFERFAASDMSGISAYLVFYLLVLPGMAYLKLLDKLPKPTSRY